MSRTLPDLIDALVAGARDRLPAVNVYDGFPTALESGTCLLVGIDDYDGNTKASAGSSSEDWAGSTFGSLIDETGTITCVALAQDGGGDLKAARDAVYQVHSELRSWLRGVLTGSPDVLGVSGVWAVRVGGVDELNQSQDGNGATALVRFPIAYQARI